MKTRRFLFVPLLLCFVGLMQLVAQQTPPPLPIDPNIRYGKLENGLTYYIRHNELPKERADFYIAQNVGSVLEEENQRGLAHFLEHMAFHGSKNFPGDGIMDYTESIGMRMGENLNAETGFDRTVYMMMNVPVMRQEVVDSCLLILHDWSSFITLSDSLIEKERGVIREEWRTGQDAQMRLWEQQLPKMYPGSRYANRLPIGTIDVINNFKPEELQAYYEKWYRPDLQAVIIVGDIDVDKVEASIKKMFADIPAPVNPAEREIFSVPDNDDPLVSIATDKEAANTILYMFYKHDKLPMELRSTAAGLITDYMQSVTATMMNERLGELVLKADPPYVYGMASDGDYFISNTKAAWMMAAVAKDGEIERAVEALATETERARQFGFTASEYERARINVLKEYESAYNEHENQRNNMYVTEYVSHFTEGGYIPGIETEYMMLSQIAPALTVEQVNQYMQQIISEKNLVISLTGPDKEDAKYPTEAELLTVYKAALQSPIEAYQETLSDEPLIPNLPAPGKITDVKENPLFKATVLTLSNGAKVVLKHTEFKKDEILMSANSVGGSSLFGNEESANIRMLNSLSSLGGLGNFSVVDLSKVLAGKKVTCQAAINQDSESLSGSSTPADIKTLFELIYLNFTAPRMDEEAYSSYINRLTAQLQNLELNPMVAFSDTITTAMYYDNPRTARIKQADLGDLSYPRIMEMYKERFADASDFVFTFVGNLDMEAIRPLIEQYLASLPSLKRTEKPNESNIPALRTGAYNNIFNRELEVPKSSVMNLFTGTMEYSLENAIMMTMLKQVLDIVYMEKVRQDEGGSYGVQSYGMISDFPKGQTVFQTYFDTDPEKRERMNQIVHAELKSVATSGPRPEDFTKTKDNIRKRHDEQLQENSYWLSSLNNYFYKSFDSYSKYLETLEGITPAKLQAFTKALLDQGNTIEVVMEP
ncbi:zinc protease [Parabacteroides sp. PF5-5]|uniref:M16 family metallopeptidase n=1 Tax=unclassified Parabacteroides TaxID=2649774 RepID=UPI0024750C89|nr:MULTISPECIES: M16 family metallopeptidase [unclassified Parabacteroides]MDH6306252.1 zinc protease [Parabacteroides sp. PH5-39]MDH6316956.1 zinc protease [Parabacteroides sp. PF5-13]MDH6321026.1 zinc protease [Parabacteroides sp. PH5-13]MDH6324758.1 zinc protease [Parabacteroides sp. PH5-8]MDH6328141.1 zinc protease [Parabacteroides sp. PH5-41]